MTTEANPSHIEDRCEVCHAYDFNCARTSRGTVECKHCRERIEAPAPRVGEGATYSIGSDSYAYTVVEVSKSGKTIVLQQDEARATKDSDFYGHQSYIYIPNIEGRREKVSRRKDGYYRTVGSRANSGGRFSIGTRRQNLDPSF